MLYSRALKTPYGFTQIRVQWHVSYHLTFEASVIKSILPSDLRNKHENKFVKRPKKKPHGSFKVICSSKHDINGVSEKTLVKVSSQTMVALAMPDNRFYSRPLPKQFVFPGFCVGGFLSFRNVGYHYFRVSWHFLSPISSVPRKNAYRPSAQTVCLFYCLVYRMTVIFIPKCHGSNNAPIP